MDAEYNYIGLGGILKRWAFLAPQVMAHTWLRRGRGVRWKRCWRARHFRTERGWRCGGHDGTG